MAAQKAVMGAFTGVTPAVSARGSVPGHLRWLLAATCVGRAPTWYITAVLCLAHSWGYMPSDSCAAALAMNNASEVLM